MHEITREQVVELAAAEISRGEDRVERVYRWQFERALAAVRAMFVLAGSIVVATLTAIIQGAGPRALWQALVVGAALSGSVSAAVCQYARLGRLYGKYLESLRIFAVVQRKQETGQWIHSRSS